MSRKKAKKPVRPDNGDDPPKTPTPPPQSAPQRSMLFWAVLVVAALWFALYLTYPLWPPEMATADAEINGPRWYLLLVPDQIVDGWLHGRVTIRGVGERLAVLLPAALWVAVAWFAGRMLLRAAPPIVPSTRAENAALSLAAGLSLQATVVLLLGLCGGVGRWWSGPLMAALTLGAAYVAARLCRWRFADGRTNAEPIRTDNPQPSWIARCGWIAVGVLTALLVARSLMPPAEYDVREYHLQAPKEWSQAGQITFMPHNIYANMPMAAEMHVLATMDWWRLANQEDAWWWGALSGKVVIGGFAWLTSLLAGCAVARITSSAAGVWAMALALAMPAMIEGASLGLIESAVACFFAAGVLIVVAMLNRQVDSPSCAWAWVGLFAGSALACKYPAVVFVVLPLALACWYASQAMPLAERVRGLAWFALLAAVAGGPWLAKNAILAHNPVYPLAASVLGGRTMDEAKIAQWNRGHATGDFSLGELGRAAQRLSWQWKSQSLLLVPLALLATACRWDRREVRFAVVGLALSVLLWWLLTHRIARFLVPSLPLLFVLAGVGWQTLRERLGSRAAVGIAAFGVLLNALMIASAVLGDVRLAVDLSALRADQAAGQEVSRVAEHVRFINDTLQADDRLLVVGDAMVFDYHPPLDYSTTFDQSPLTAITGRLPAKQWQRAFQQAGWTHVLVHWGEIQRLRSTYGFDERITPELFARLQQAGILRLVRDDLTGGVVEVYAVQP